MRAPPAHSRLAINSAATTTSTSRGRPASTIMPVPYGMIIDAGRPQLVLVVVAALLMASLLCAGGARIRFRRPLVPEPAE